MPAPCPIAHRIAEDVVEDLEALAVGIPVGGGHAAHDPQVGRAERDEHAGDLVGGLLGVIGGGEVVRRPADLRAGRRDEVAEDRFRDRLLALGQGLHRTVEVQAHDGRRPTDILQRRAPQDRGIVAGVGIPEPLHRELQERRLDHIRGAFGRGRARIGELGEHVVDEAVLDLDRRPSGFDAPLVDAGDRLDDGFAGRGLRERRQAQVVVEQGRHAALEAVELRQRVVAQRDQDPHAQVQAIDDLRKQRVERVLARHRVQAQVLLELVEDQQERPLVALTPLLDRLVERRWIIAGGGGRGNAARQRDPGVARPFTMEQ